jgi:MFS family permease
VRLTLLQRVAYLGSSFSIGVYGAFNNYTMSLWLTGFTTSYVLISLLGNSKSVEGAVVSPLAGLWSDHTWLGWLGRRRPFILVGGLLSAGLLAATPTIARLPVPPSLSFLPADVVRMLPIVVVVVLFTLTFNLADDIHKALRADLVKDAELNLLSSLATVVEIGAQFGVLGLGFLLWSDAVPDWAFPLAGALVAVGILATTLGVREPPPAVWEAHLDAAHAVDERLSLRDFLRHYRGAVMFCLVIFAYWSGVNAVLPLISIYVRDILGTTVGEAQLLPGLLLLSTALSAVPVGWLATRFGKRRILAAGCSVMVLAAVAALVIVTKEQGAVVFFLAGVGNTAAVVLAVPIMAELVPKHRLGAATGFLAGAGSIAAPLASLVAGGLSQIYGPRVIFAVMAVMVACAILLLLGVVTLEESASNEGPSAQPENTGGAEPAEVSSESATDESLGAPSPSV